ncbi:DNA-binding IclR family transcriptional regulator [Novosphingobium capsulatum]|uniref:DNA-binding IclR family transcriptional regulator n=1 Tax=Novosphingobium capsulatum TaxID=13688 RepID=A0ABU1MMR0_9SPHN|nr:IclR family transcriptional regulator [Novosphingobium capsulatum]MDR6511557.1 DNA-binding IclR family transcriptional regulator [Novosphingobium capsulatum]
MDGGSKTIDRVGAILKVLENGPEEGMTSTEIAKEAGFDKATAYRALVSLSRIGLLDRDAESRRFRLGAYLFSLGAVAARRFSVLAHARKALAVIAKETGDTVFLSVRNKYDSVCIDCAIGSYPIRAQTLTVGESVPLGVSTAGVAMLSTMDDSEVRHAVQFNAVNITTKFKTIRPDQIYEHVARAREVGYSLYTGQIIAGMAGIGRPIRAADGRGLAVISVTAVIDRMSEARVRMINGLLKAAIEDIEQRALLIGSQLETLA